MKKFKKRALCAFIMTAAAILSACGGTKPESESFQAMDTLMTLTVYGDSEIGAEIKEEILSLDKALDATDENSEIHHLNTEKTASVSDNTADLLNRSLQLCGDLDGCFDLTVYPAVTAWGFTTGDYRVPGDSELKALAEKIDYTSVAVTDNRVTLPKDVTVDLGAVAKGYAADKSIDILKNSRARAAVLNLGGTIGLYGKKPDGSRFKIGIADPENSAGYFGYLTCDSGVVATSGGYERFFEQDGNRYIHILDPATARPVDNHIASVTVITDNGAKADAMSTALFVMGLDKASEYYRSHDDFDCIILTDDDRLYLTDGVYDDFTLDSGYSYTIHRISKS